MEEEGQAVRLVRLVLVRRLCLLLGVAPAEAVAALKQAEFDEQQALYSLMYSLQPQEHLEDEKAEKDHEGIICLPPFGDGDAPVRRLMRAQQALCQAHEGLQVFC